MVRAIAAPRQQKMNLGSVYADYGGQIDKTLPNIVTRAAGDVGMAVVRQALPMVMSLLKMVLIISTPLLFTLATYDIRAFVTISCVHFALYFVDFWFEMARWIDSTILDALYGWGMGFNRPHMNFNIMLGLDNTFGDMLLNFVMGTMFIVLPTFWVTALGWVGVRAGGAMQGLSDGTAGAGKAGSKGAETMSGGKLR